jgi:hypothetical protein
MPHFIQRFKFDVEIEGRDDAWSISNDLSTVFNSELESILDRVLTEFDLSEFVIRIPYMEIDLGNLLETSLISTIPSLFETKLRQELKLILAELDYSKRTGAGTSKGEMVRLTPARMEVLAYYLMHGHFPVGAEKMNITIEQLLRELIAEGPEAVAKLIRKSARSSTEVVKRIASNFSEAAIASIYSLFAPNHHHTVATYETEVSAQIAEELNISLRIVKHNVQKAVLRNLISEAQSIFDTTTFRAGVGKELVAVYGEAVADIVSGNAPSEGSGVKAKAKKEGEGEKPITESQNAAISVILAAIHGEYLHGGKAMIVEAWEYLMTEAPTVLQRLLAKEAVKVESLTRLLRVMPLQAVRDFVVKVAPATSTRLLTAASAVISAYGLYGKGPAQEQQVVAEVYLATLHFMLRKPEAESKPEAVTEAIRVHLESLPQPPIELLEDWMDLGLPGTVVSTPEQTSVDAPSDEKGAPLSPEKEAETKAQRKAEAKKRRLNEAKLRGDLPLSATEADLDELERDLEIAEEESTQPKPKTRKRRLDAQGQPLDVDSPDADEGEEEGPAEEEEDPWLPREKPQKQPRVEEFVPPKLETAVGRMEFVLHYLATGEPPWWAPKGVLNPFESHFAALAAQNPEILLKGIKELVPTVPRSRYAEIVHRLVTELNEKNRAVFLQSMAPEIAGFINTVAIALGSLFDAPVEGMTIPPYLKERSAFAWHYPVRYVIEYLSGTLSAAEMLRYVMKEIAQAIGLSPRRFIEVFTAVAQAAAAKGERRFVPLLSMMPRPFEGLEVDAPPAHAGEVEEPTVSKVINPEAEEIRLAAEAEQLAAAESKKTAEAEAEELKAETERLAAEASEKEAQLAETTAQEMEVAQLAAAQEREAAAIQREVEQLRAAEMQRREAEQLPPLTPEEAQAMEAEILRQAETKVQAVAKQQAVEAESERVLTPEEQQRKVMEEEASKSSTILPKAEGKETESPKVEGKESELPIEKGKEKESPKVEGKEKETPKVEGKEKETPKVEGKEKETPKVEGKEKETPKVEGKEPLVVPPTTDSDEEETDEPVSGDEADGTPRSRKKPKAEPAMEEAALPTLAEVFAEQERQAAESVPLVEEYGYEEFVEAIRHYLVHGSLSPKATRLFTAETFRAAVYAVMQQRDRQVVRMLREIVPQHNVRMRLLELGKPIAFSAIRLMNVMIADRFLPFIEDMLELFEGSTAPIPSGYVLEHAMRFAVSQGAAFLPLDYVQSFLEYVRVDRRKDVPQVLAWIQKRLDTSVAQRRVALQEVFDYVVRKAAARESQLQSMPEAHKREMLREEEQVVYKKVDDELYVNNSGLCIVFPYLTQLFKMLDLITENRKAFKSEQARIRAVYLMQYIVNKETEPQEEDLVLNKMFAGMPIEMAMDPLETPITEAEMETIDGMLGVVLKRWPPMANASLEYLRQTFFMREGRLRYKEHKWILRVKQQGLDVLLNKMPWAVTPIRLPWLEDQIEVEWK